MKNIIFWILRWTWELPQTLVGLIVFLTTTSYAVKSKRTSFYRRVKGFGVSLGGFIFFDDSYDPWVPYHETGHAIQSRILGPLYLLLVGLPSLLFNILTQMKVFNVLTYYTRYPENWADLLGGVKRDSTEEPPPFGPNS